MSGIRPYDIAAWALEAAPVVLALPVLVGTRRRFPLTDVVYVGIFLYGVVLVFGGTCRLLDLDRNPYNDIGHFLQGFVIALVVREILIRGQFLRSSGSLGFFITCIVLASSATYALVKWAAALALGLSAGGTQADTLCALAGALAALLLFSRVHDRRLKRLDRLSRVLEIEARTAH